MRRQQQEEKQQQQQTLPSFRRSPQPTQRAAEDNCVLLRGLLHLFWHNLNASSVVILRKIEIVFACFPSPALPPSFGRIKRKSSMQFSLLQACFPLQPCPNPAQLPLALLCVISLLRLNVNLYSICFLLQGVRNPHHPFPPFPMNLQQFLGKISADLQRNFCE